MANMEIINRLHEYAEMLRKAKMNPELQCALRWGATKLASLLIETGRDIDD